MSRMYHERIKPINEARSETLDMTDVLSEIATLVSLWILADRLLMDPPLQNGVLKELQKVWRDTVGACIVPPEMYAYIYEKTVPRSALRSFILAQCAFYRYGTDELPEIKVDLAFCPHEMLVDLLMKARKGVEEEDPAVGRKSHCWDMWHEGEEFQERRDELAAGRRGK